jgi:hypothetical protein
MIEDGKVIIDDSKLQRALKLDKDGRRDWFKGDWKEDATRY